ncbi:MAG: hypothetical protein A2138_05795 [Deltaproteobacteria bacterium RBG_16_71_12]|nr:MAG: hypothetical protein A2138_05795 [Deltaproteobacteria bacterium RBG_16_71_12]
MSHVRSACVRAKSSATGQIEESTLPLNSAARRACSLARSSWSSIFSRPLASALLHAGLPTAGHSCSACTRRLAIDSGTGPTGSVSSSTARAGSCGLAPIARTSGSNCRTALSEASPAPPTEGKPWRASA